MSQASFTGTIVFLIRVRTNWNRLRFVLRFEQEILGAAESAPKGPSTGPPPISTPNTSTPQLPSQFLPRPPGPPRFSGPPRPPPGLPRHPGPPGPPPGVPERPGLPHHGGPRPLMPPRPPGPPGPRVSVFHAGKTGQHVAIGRACTF